MQTYDSLGAANVLRIPHDVFIRFAAERFGPTTSDGRWTDWQLQNVWRNNSNVAALRRIRRELEQARVDAARIQRAINKHKD